jgi:FtsH-binding integral membrane protein
MSYTNQNPYQSYTPFGNVAAMAAESERTAFIRRTYTHLAGAIAAFVLIETLIFTLVPETTLQGLIGTMVSGWNWLMVLGAFMVVSWIAQSWAASATSLSTQYLGLSLYVVAEAIIFVPLLYVANRFAPGTIASAGLLTTVIFGGLTAVVFFTRADFSYLRMYLWLGGFAALGAIVCGIVFQLNIFGVIFSLAMVALAGGYVLYYTSNVLHHYRLDQHVSAALALFAAVALLFWYILRILMALKGRD